MNEETIFDQNEVKEEKQGYVPLNDDETVLDGQPNSEQNEAPKDKKKKDYKTAGIAGAAGVAGAALGVLFPFNNVLPEEPNGGDGISDDMVTHPAPSASGQLTGHDMDVATGVNDSMSFSQAFAAARHEVGPGGIFVWHGNTYGTHYANEWNAMSPEEHDQYWADVHHTTSNLKEMSYETPDPDPIPDPAPTPHDPLANGQNPNENHGGEDNSNDTSAEPQSATTLGEGDGLANNGEGDGEPIDDPVPPVEPGEGMAYNEPFIPIDDPEVPSELEEPLEIVNSDEPIETTIDEPEPLELAEEDVIAEFDLDGDGVADTGFVDANGNEVLDVVSDTTGDGSYDTLVIDPEVDEDGNLVVAEDNIKEIGGVEINDLNADADLVIDGSETGDDDLFTEDTIDDNIIAENPDVDDFASFEPDSDITIDNDMDMSDFV